MAGLFLCAQVANADALTDALSLKMKYLSANQSTISKNLANSNTPGYKAMELKEPKYGHGKGLTLATTSPMHLGGAGSGGGANFKTVKQKDTYETAPNGNNVSIEDQMVKMNANNMEHQAATNLVKKINGLANLATGER